MQQSPPSKGPKSGHSGGAPKTTPAALQLSNDAPAAANDAAPARDSTTSTSTRGAVLRANGWFGSNATIRWGKELDAG